MCGPCPYVPYVALRGVWQDYSVKLQHFYSLLAQQDSLNLPDLRPSDITPLGSVRILLSSILKHPEASWSIEIEVILSYSLSLLSPPYLNPSSNCFGVLELNISNSASQLDWHTDILYKNRLYNRRISSGTRTGTSISTSLRRSKLEIHQISRQHTGANHEERTILIRDARFIESHLEQEEHAAMLMDLKSKAVVTALSHCLRLNRSF